MKNRNCLLIFVSCFSFLLSAQAFADEVNLYTSRQKFLLEPIIESFTKKTGVEVNVFFAKKGLIEKVAREGKNTPADAILTVDIGELDLLKKKDVVKPIKSKLIESRVPSNYREQNNLWVGVSLRARVIYASKDRVAVGEITSYEDLADPKWHGKICTRSGKHPYNLALFASLIAHNGKDSFVKWLKGLKSNLQRKPQGNDRAQVKAIYSGLCDLSIGNSYYYGKMAFNEKEPVQKKWADSARAILPNNEGRGTHVNVSGVALSKYGKNERNALAFIEFLVSDEAQKIYAKINHEFPIVKGIEPSAFIQKYFRGFKPDPLSLDTIIENRQLAGMIVDEIKFDF